VGGAECEIDSSEGAKVPRRAWRGHVKSGVIEWNVSELPPDQRLLTLTDKQTRLVDQWLSGKHRLPEDSMEELDDPLVRQVLDTRNEGLATRLLEVLKQDMSADHRFEAWTMLRLRAGSPAPGELGIEGPYLKQLAH
jgi:hypothetical protein